MKSILRNREELKDDAISVIRRRMALSIRLQETEKRQQLMT
jgi:hypothetical protein